MNSISRTAKLLDRICGILYWVLLVGMVLCFFAVVLLAIPILGGTELFKDNQSYSLSLGSLRLLLAPGVMAGITAPGYEKNLLWTAIFALGSMPVYFVMLLTVRDVLQPFIRKEPFHGMVAKDLKRLSILLLLNTVLNWIAAGLADHMTRTYLDIETLFPNSSQVISVNLASTAIELTPLLFAAALYLLSKVFLYGQELQQLSDETL